MLRLHYISIRHNPIIFARILTLLVFFLSSKTFYSQKSILIECTDNPTLNRKLNTGLKSRLDDSEIKNVIREKLNFLNSKGYLLAQTDTLILSDQKILIKLVSGQPFKWGKIKTDLKTNKLLEEMGIRPEKFNNKPISPIKFAQLHEAVLKWNEDNGYPFASSYFDSILIENEIINSTFKLERNKFIQIDSIVIKGNVGTKKSFIQNYLSIKPGDPYSEEKFKKITKNIKQLTFLKEIKPSILYIDDQHNKIILTLDKRNTSQFDGILGLLPNSSGKTVFTGDVKVKLQNLVFKSGELIELNWRRLMFQTQDLKARLNYPFLFNTKLGIDYSIKLYKKDTTFIDVLQSFSLQFLFKGLNHIKAIYKTRNSSILSTNGLENISVLPEFADIKSQSYGLGLSIENLDYKLNPRRGFSVQQQAVIGNRNIKKNAGINELVYEQIKLKSNQYQFDNEVNLYFPIGEKSTLKNCFQLGSVGGNKIFRNELFRIGGFRSLRGFDEESIFASTFLIYSLEYRFLFEENSSLILFSDLCWYENVADINYINDFPKSFGTGINFETKSGIISLNYALGAQFGNPIDFRNGKIHFGFVSLF